MLAAFAKNTLGPLVLRLGLAALFLSQGLEKITRPGTEWGTAWHRTGYVPPPAMFARSDQPPPPPTLPVPVQLAVSWGEVAGGIALLIGFLTRWVAAGLFILRAGAIGVYTFQERFSLPEGGGYEYNIALLVMCVTTLFLGGGTFALDRLFQGKRKSP